MKYLLISLSLLFLFACSNDAEKIKEAETTGKPAHQSQQLQQGKKSPGPQNSVGVGSAVGSFVEENDSCICTKDWTPVCGKDGQTYPNACQAKCEGVEEFTSVCCKNN